MRKFDNVDIVAALGAVVELNTANYKSDFKYDIEMFKEAARNPDGENNRFLWLSRPSGTYCHLERDVYVKDTAAFNYWNGCATILGKDTPFDKVIVNERVLSFAVNITGIENGKIKGDLYELNYPDHVRQLHRVALPLHTVTVKHEDGTTLTLPHKEYDGKRERLYHQHGKVIDYKSNPQDPDALRIVLKVEREQREKDARPATFKVRVQNPKQPGKKQPTIKQQIEAGKKQLEQQRAAAPAKAAVKSKNTGLEV
jgi:hypothetical protein